MYLDPELWRVVSGDESSRGAPSRSSSEAVPLLRLRLLLSKSAKISSSCLALFFFLDGSLDSTSGSILSHLLVATTGAGASHFDDLDSRFRSRLLKGDCVDEGVKGIPSKSSDTTQRNKCLNYCYKKTRLLKGLTNQLTWSSINIRFVFTGF